MSTKKNKKIDKEYSQKKVLKQFKAAAKNGTLGRGTLAKKFAKPLDPSIADKQYAEGKSTAKDEPLFPGQLKPLFTFYQILDMIDRRIISNLEAREMLGINTKKEVSDELEPSVSEDSSVDKSEGQIIYTDEGIGYIEKDKVVAIDSASDTPAEPVVAD